MRTYDITITYRIRVKAGNPDLALEKVEETFPDLSVPENIEGVTLVGGHMDVQLKEEA